MDAEKSDRGLWRRTPVKTTGGAAVRSSSRVELPFVFISQTRDAQRSSAVPDVSQLDTKDISPTLVCLCAAQAALVNVRPKLEKRHHLFISAFF